jgi:hypothetical protein
MGTRDPRMYQGMLCSMASFNQHCAFGLWKGSLILEQGGDRARDAKSDATRQRRIDQAIEWIAEGKSRNWKYERK